MSILNFILYNIYYPFVKYRIHISVIFLFLLINVYENIVKQKIDWPVVISFFSWHFALYIFDRAYDNKLDAVNQPNEAILPSEKNFAIILSILLCLLPIPILFYFNKNLIPYLAFIPITFLYNYPVYKGVRSKNIVVFKNFYSAFFIWTLPLTVVVYFYTKSSFAFIEIFNAYFIGLFIYVMIGEAFWDIRDIEGDRLVKVNTLPVLFGTTFTKIYLLALILIDLFIVGNQVTSSAIIYFILLIFIKPTSPRWIFHLPPLLGLYRFLYPILIN